MVLPSVGVVVSNLGGKPVQDGIPPGCGSCDCVGAILEGFIGIHSQYALALMARSAAFPLGE